jgi:hypothetical protein
MFVKYINRMASSASLQKGGVIKSRASRTSQSETRPYSRMSSMLSISNYRHSLTPKQKANKYTKIDIDKAKVLERTDAMKHRKEFNKHKESFNKDIRLLIKQIQYNDENVDYNTYITGIKMQIRLITLIIQHPKNVVYLYSYRSDGSNLLLKGEEHIITASNHMLERIEIFTIALSEKNNTNQDLYNLLLNLFDFASNVLSLYIPDEVNTMFKKLSQKISDWRSRNAAINAHTKAVELQKYLKYDELMAGIIERSLAHYTEINRLESERERERYKQATTAGGKSMKPKQHRNGKTQKKRQRKNQKK